MTRIDNGMPVVVMRAADVGATGYESPAAPGLKARIERIRLLAGPPMGFGDVSAKVVPKMALIALASRVLGRGSAGQINGRRPARA